MYFFDAQYFAIFSLSSPTFMARITTLGFFAYFSCRTCTFGKATLHPPHQTPHQSSIMILPA